MPELIHSLDPGQSCGYALGEAGTIPRSGAVILRQKKEVQKVGVGNLIAYLSTVWAHRKPDLLVYEEPLSIAAWFQTNKKRPFPTDPSGVESAFRLEGAILGAAQRFGIRTEPVRRQTILKHMTGSGKQVSRAEGKQSIIDACFKRGLVDVDCTDDDRCDAIANFVYASEFFFKKPVGNFSLSR